MRPKRTRSRYVSSRPVDDCWKLAHAVETLFQRWYLKGVVPHAKALVSAMPGPTVQGVAVPDTMRW